MRVAGFLLSSLAAFLLVYSLNKPWGEVPALGKLLSPTHGFWTQIEGEKPDLPGEIRSDQLKGQVEVVWDEHLIPHIFALHDEDLYFVQGYVTAQMRLWQMDFQTRAAAGRISEVVGDVALDFDKSMRRQGMLTGARKSLEAAMKDENVKVAFERYAAGVNAFIGTLNERTLPLEYKLLGMKPEEWSPERSMLLLLYMANQLNTFNNDIENTNFINEYGLAEFANLFPRQDDQEEPIVNWPGMWVFPPVNSTADGATDIIPVPHDFTDHEKPDPSNGSNNWAVSGFKSARGYAILANDPHLGLNLPALWFTIHLNSPSQNVMGASLPGTPAIVIGFNERVAWGFTNAQRDLVDYYKVKFADDKKTAILVDGVRESVRMEVHEIKSKSGRVEQDTIWHSSFGIIGKYSKLPAKEKNTAWAYRWVGQDASEVAIALVKLNLSTGMNDFMEATNHFHSPAQNIVFADVEGNIGIRVQGKFLPREPYEGLFLRDGTTAVNRWNRFIPNYQNISIFNPERGFVSSANQYPVDSTYPYYISANLWESYRNRRINRLLSKDSITVDYVKQMQSDNYNLKAVESVPFFLAALHYEQLNDDEKQVYNLLKNWNYYNEAEQAEPVYYEAWWDALYQQAWDEMDASAEPMPKPSVFHTIKLLKSQPELKFFDLKETKEQENAGKLIRMAFSKGVKDIETWKEQNPEAALTWSNFKNTKIVHLTRQMAFSVQQVPVGGNHEIVNATSERHGPSWRQVVELNPKEVKAWGIYPGGQSGNPGSAWYTNWIDLWAKGQYIELDLYGTPSTLYGKAVQNTTFKPFKL